VASSHSPIADVRIDLQTLQANYTAISRLASGAETAAVVKADAYGLGMRQVARALTQVGCETFFVAHSAEGLALRRVLGPHPTIMVLNGPDEEDLRAILSADLTPVINSLDQLSRWLAVAPDGERKLVLHLDTGMARLGLQSVDMGEARELIGAGPVAMVMSHLACPDAPSNPMNARQLAVFRDLAKLFPGAAKSLSATAGAYLGPAFCFDMLRPGIGLYGGGPPPPATVTIAPVVTLRAPILSIMHAQAGDTCGYGATWTSDRPRRLATLAIGYADGYLRTLSNRGFGILNGVRCPLVGRVSMDLISLDVSAAQDDAIPGAMIELIGPHAPLEEVAERAGTIGYELLTRLGPRIARRYVNR